MHTKDSKVGHEVHVERWGPVTSQFIFPFVHWFPRGLGEGGRLPSCPSWSSPDASVIVPGVGARTKPLIQQHRPPTAHTSVSRSTLPVPLPSSIRHWPRSAPLTGVTVMAQVSRTAAR
jgi:hypothetical protein